MRRGRPPANTTIQAAIDGTSVAPYLPVRAHEAAEKPTPKPFPNRVREQAN